MILFYRVLPDGPAASGAATSWRVYPFLLGLDAGALPLVGIGMLLLVVVADEAAVDDVGGAGAVGAVVGGEEESEAGDFFRGPHAAQRDVGKEGVEFGLVGHHFGVDGGGDGSGGDVVD